MDPTLDASASGLPYKLTAHDALRNGLASLKEDAKQKHPVDIIQDETTVPGMNNTTPQMMRDLYGLAFPAKFDIEKQILSKFGRLPGLQSSRLGLESLTGELDQFGFESYLGLPEFSEQMPVDMHSQMEQRLGMGSSTKPLARGMF
jgi:proteasome maturation protein